MDSNYWVQKVKTILTLQPIICKWSLVEYTFSQLRAQVDLTCFPPSASSTVQDALINKARNMFYNSAFGQIWLGTEVALSLVVTIQSDNSRTITLPRGVETLVGVYGACGIQLIRNQWFHYLRIAPTQPVYGPQWDDEGYSCGVYDFSSTGSTISVTTTSNEAGALTITFIGTNINGIRISETLTVPTVSGNTVTTSSTFYSVTEVYRLATVGDLIVNLGSNFYARYQPSELCPKYRRYKFNGCTNDTAVYAIAKREFITLSGNDPMDINNVPAIENGLRAYRAEQSQDYFKAQEAMGAAVGYLNGELARFQGETSQVPVALDPTCSFGRIWNIE